MTNAELSILLTDDREIRTLNAQYRQVDTSTDVLAFPMLDSKEVPKGYDGPIGDVVISVERALGQHTSNTHREHLGETDRWSLTHEILFLLVHGLLHLVGYDHREDEHEEQMDQAQRRFFASICPT